MVMTPKERIFAALKQQTLDRPPVAVFTQSATVGQMDRLGAAWPEAHMNPELMAKLAAGQADIFGFEVVRTAFCLTAETEALGARVAVEKKEAAPMIKEHPVKFDPLTKVYDDYESMLISPEEMVKTGRCQTVIDSIKLLKKSHGDNYAIVAGSTGPFTIAGNLVNTENLIYGMMVVPDLVEKITAFINPYVKAYTEALFEAGADVVQCSEPSGSTDMLTPDMFEPTVGKFVRTSLAPREKDDKYSVLHICGNTLPILKFMAATGVTGISIEEKVDPFDAVKTVDGACALVGNVGSVKPLYRGKPEDVEAAAKRSAEAGFNIISPGCGVAPKTPDVNMEALVRAIKSLA